MAAVPLPRFRQLAHTADVRLAVWGASEAELLANAAAGALWATASLANNVFCKGVFIAWIAPGSICT